MKLWFLFLFHIALFSNLSHMVWISCCHAGLIYTTYFSEMWNSSLHSDGLQYFDFATLLFKKLPSRHYIWFCLKKKTKTRKIFFSLSCTVFYPVESHCTSTVATISSILMVYKVIALLYCWITQVNSYAVSNYLKQKRKNISPKK